MEHMNSNRISNENTVKQWVLSLLAVISVSLFPLLFLYFQNANEAAFVEVFPPVPIVIGLATVIFTVFLLITKNAPKAAIVTSLFMMLLLNYAYLEKGVRYILSGLRYWHILPIFLFVFAHIAWLICKKMQKEHANMLVLIICLVFSGLILFNGVMAMPNIIRRASAESIAKKEKAKTTQTVAQDTDLPNIYLLIFDEYSSVDFMRKYYNYDNSDFTDYLEKLGFNVSYTSHNECISTKVILANLVNLDYVIDHNTPESAISSYSINNYLFKYLASKGYTITGIGNIEMLGIENSAMKISSLNAKTVSGETVVDLFYKRTVLWPFYKVSYNQAQKIIISAFEYLKNPDNFPQNGSLTICHVDCPHEPFHFDRNGRVYEVPSMNWKDPEYYLGQYIFTTNQMREIVNSIVNNDPGSIIILQSDHGARASSDPDLYMEKFTLEDMSHIFNAVYFRGEKLDIEGLSGVNTLRLVFNKAFGEKYEMLEVPPDNFKYK